MSEFIVNLETLIDYELLPNTVLAPGALASQVGKTVPVFLGEGENKREVGTAVIFQDGDHISASIQLHTPDSSTLSI